jgi:hypothetical protein
VSVALQLEFDPEQTSEPRPALVQRRYMPRDGRARLLRKLVENGLSADALEGAAALVLALHREAYERAEAAA